MPEKEGAEEKTTKDVVTKKQKQLMNKEEYVQEMPDDVKNIMMKGLRKGAGEFSRGGDPKNIIKKGVKSTIKNVIKSKSVQNFLNNEYIPEEGYDVARDQGRVKPSKDKKDATTMPRSKEMEKTRKVNKGPSALERVKADIEKRYGKGAIMDVKKEELDLTKVAEAFGGFIVEKKQFKQGKLFKFKSGAKGEIASGSPEMGGESEKFVKGKKKKFNILTDPDPDADSLAAKSETDKGVKQQVDKEINKAKAERNLKSKVKTGTTKAGEDASKIVKKTTTTTPKVTGDTTPQQKNIFGGQDDVKTKRKSGGGRPRGSRTKIKTSPGQQTLDLGNVKGRKSPVRFKKGDTIRTDLRTAKTRVSPKATPKQMASVQKDIAKRSQKKLATTVAKRQARNVVKKQLIKTAAKKAATKGVAKAGGKFLAKRIPGVGAIISGGEAVGRAAAGDYVGAALAGAEGIASFVPGLGTAVSTGLGAIGAARDVRKATKAASTVKKVIKATKGKKRADSITRSFRKIPKVKPKDLLQKPKLKIPKGSTKAQTKRLEQIYGKTRLGRLTRQAVGAGTVTGIGKKAFQQVRGAIPNLDQGHVGRRTAG